MQLDLFKLSLPKKPYCSNDLSQGLIIRNTSQALQRKYIQHNHINSKTWLSFDIDRQTCIDEITDDLNLPCPTLLIQNKQNGHAHALYALDIPVHLNESSSIKAVRFAAAVDTSLSGALDADPNYVGLITKNPFSDYWQTYDVGPSYDLHDLSEYVDLQSDRRRALDNVGLGRNCNLFDSVRRSAYQAINSMRGLGFDKWAQHVLRAAESFNNQFAAPLPWSEVKSVAKSVSAWVWRFYTGSGKINRGRDLNQNMQLDLHDKQVLSSIITGRQRVERTQQAIRHAVERLQALDKKVTQRAVSELSSLSLKTVKRHWNLTR